MREFIVLLIKIITKDIFIGYGLFTLLYLLASLIRKNLPLIKKLDLAANRFIAFAGVIYFLCVVTIIIFTVANGYEIRWLPLIQLLLWITITQLLWIERITGMRFIRLIFALLLIVSFELFVIVVTTLHRDYTTGGLFSGMTVIDVVIGLTSKTVTFCILAVIFSWLVDKFSSLRMQYFQ